MKRRAFLAASSLLALFGNDAFAKPKKSNNSSGGGRDARRGGGSSSSAHGGRNARGGNRYRRVGGGEMPTGNMPRNTVLSADTSVIDAPPAGSSATRLPPVKAPEPPALWRTFEITTVIELPSSREPSRLWLPLPFSQDTLFQRNQATTWKTNAANASMRRRPDGELEVFLCEWTGKEGVPQLEISSTVSTADRLFDVTKRTMPPEREDILRKNLQASNLLPNEGFAHELGGQIVGRIKDPVAQARAVYDWVIDNTIYDNALPAGGLGNVKQQLEQRQYGGRSADINGLFVAICRAIGLPARCVYGVRIGGSRLFKSLGLKDENATFAQHCRAEFYVPGYSWIPVDPSDVRRVIALEALSDRDPKIMSLRRVLFGVWEMNWVAYNYSSDTPLPNLEDIQPFFMRPLSQQQGKLNLGQTPDNFRYTMKSKQILDSF